MSRLPINRPVRIAADLKAEVFEDVDVNLYDLHAASHGAALGMTQGRVFRGCRIQGPAIMLVSSGVHFDDCNFGAPEGGMRNLVLRPTGDRALGTVPLRDCLFEGCEFFNVGFTGSEDVIRQLLSVGGPV
jgi:hypothetical protein